MPSQSNKVTVKKCDNQLVLVAYTGSTGYVLAQFNYTGDSPRDATLTIEIGEYGNPAIFTNDSNNSKQTVHIPKGSYNLVGIGVNWRQAKDNPWEFEYQLNGKPKQDVSGTDPTDGVMWHSDPQSFEVS